MKQIAIIGAGNWGTALAIVAARAGHNVNLWSRATPRHLNSASIPATVRATTDLGEGFA